MQSLYASVVFDACGPIQKIMLRGEPVEASKDLNGQGRKILE